MISQTSDSPYVEEYVADTAADMAHIKDTCSLKTCGVGSTCFCIETGDAYMLNSKDEWIKL